MHKFSENAEYVSGNGLSSHNEQVTTEGGYEYFHPQNLKRLLVEAGYLTLPNLSADTHTLTEYYEKEVPTPGEITRKDTFELIFPKQERNRFVMNLHKLLTGKDNQQVARSSISRTIRNKFGFRTIQVEGVLGKDETIIPKEVTLSSEPLSREAKTTMVGDMEKNQVLGEIFVQKDWQTTNSILLVAESESTEGAESTTLDPQLSADLLELFRIDIKGKTATEVLQLLIERVNQRLQPE